MDKTRGRGCFGVELGPYIQDLVLDDFIVLSSQNSHSCNEGDSVPCAADNLVNDNFGHRVFDIELRLALLLLARFALDRFMLFGSRESRL